MTSPLCEIGRWQGRPIAVDPNTVTHVQLGDDDIVRVTSVHGHGGQSLVRIDRLDPVEGLSRVDQTTDTIRRIHLTRASLFPIFCSHCVGDEDDDASLRVLAAAAKRGRNEQR